MTLPYLSRRFSILNSGDAGDPGAPNAVISASPLNGHPPLTVTFDGSLSNDPDGTIDTYDWDFDDAGATDTGVSVMHTYASTGSYSPTLTVTDNEGNTDVSTIFISIVNNNAPNAVATANPLSGRNPLTVTFDGSLSNDPDGTIDTYAWDFDDGGATDTGVSVMHTYTTAGTYNPTLTVTDDDGATDVDNSLTINIALNQAPNAVAAANPVSGHPSLLVNFDGSGSTDADGNETIVAWDWDFGDTNTDSGEMVSHTYTSVGTYNVSLTVTDDKGLTDVDNSITINVVDNVPPTADASLTSPISGDAPLDVDFDGSASTDGDGTITLYSWDYGDTNTATGVTPPTHTYLNAGNYLASLTVTDDDGATDVDNVSITVTDPFNVHPELAVGHWDANQGVTPNGSTSSQWDDLSTAGFSFTQGASSSQFLINGSDSNFNGHTSLTADGVNDFMNCPFGYVYSGISSYFVVYRFLSLASKQRIFGGTSPNTTVRRVFFLSGATGNLSIYQQSTADSGLAPTTDTTIGYCEFSNTTSRLHINGGANLISTATGGYNQAGICLAAGLGGSLNRGNVAFGYFIRYEQALTTTQANTIGNSLATRFNRTWTNIT